jgi:hypothetical protein
MMVHLNTGWIPEPLPSAWPVVTANFPVIRSNTVLFVYFRSSKRHFDVG